MVTDAAERLFERFPPHPVERRMSGASESWVDVPGGAIRVFRMPGATAGAPDRRPGVLPVLFVPGWGGVIEGFYETLRAVDPSVDLFYVETREKRSSRLSRRASFSMPRIAADVGRVATAMGLSAGSYVLAGSSFGGAVVTQALADRVVAPASAVLYDPMPRLWLPRWIMSFLAPLAPAWLLTQMRPVLKRLVLAGMREETQRRRTERFIDDAVLWKWRAAALRLREWDIYAVAPRVGGRVDVVHGSADRFHDSSIYPAVARSIRGARLVHVPIPETSRERLIGAVLSAYALDAGRSGALPSILALFERGAS